MNPIASRVLAILCLFSASCEDGGSSGAVGATSPPNTSFVQIHSERLDGAPSTEFRFTTTLFGSEAPTEIVWDFGDGRTGVGPFAQVRYPAPGLYTVRVSGTFPSAGVVSSELDIGVFDPQGGPVLLGTEVPLPALLGDVDGDLQLTAGDAARIAAHVQGVQALSASAWRAADFSLDGSVDLTDVDLLESAVGLGGSLPDWVHPASGPRGSTVQLISEHLRNLDALIEVRVGAAPPRPVRRVHPGYGLFVIPMDALGVPTTDPVSEGWVPVELLVDRVAVQVFDFTLVNAPAYMGDELAILRGSAHELQRAVLDLRGVVAADFELLGTASDDRRIVQALLDSAETECAAAATEIEMFTAQLPEQHARSLAYICNAAGLREARAAALAWIPAPHGTAPPQPGEAGNAEVDFIERLGSVRAFADALHAVTLAIQLSNSGVGELSSLAIVPRWSALRANVLAARASMESVSGIAGAVSALWPRLAGGLDVSTSIQPGASPNTYHVGVTAPLEPGLDCGAQMSFAELAQGAILERLSSRPSALASYRVLRDACPFDPLTGRLRPAVLDRAVTYLQGLSAEYRYELDSDGLRQWLDDLQLHVCRTSTMQRAVTVRASELSALTPTPSDAGTAIVSGFGVQFAFECAGSASSYAALRAELPVVGSTPIVGTGIVSCGGDCLSGFATPLGMVQIPAGSFPMGSNAPSGPPYYGSPAQQPVHQVTLSHCFWMGATEVTQAQFAALMGTNPSQYLGANKPVEQVTWHDAAAYCAALDAQQSGLGLVPPGYQYRLPTEAEWEYACRAGTTTEFNVGDQLLCGQARFWYSLHSNSYCGAPWGTDPVGSHPANAWGLFDMHGNVREWCYDSYTNYPSGPITDPFHLGPGRIQRGGHWSGNSRYCRSAFRGASSMTDYSSALGFRVVLAPILLP
ncbi:MAG: SUMF1/EgtB/PvdO family nonheme iron enzyme [Planctomycetes bacterium]|nr:SUMF1/EgtB/PvdO family nonheme iron enzyme [Planctomycetota bacterium]